MTRQKILLTMYSEILNGAYNYKTLLIKVLPLHKYRKKYFMGHFDIFNGFPIIEGFLYILIQSEC